MDRNLFTVGLAIFSMLFGAGNLIYPLMVGVSSGWYTWIGMIAFLLTATVLPLVGLITMILFDGDYDTFFGRMGKIPGKIAIFLCMMIIGPGIAIPRITTLSHIMIAPFIPFLPQEGMISSFIFALLFLGVTFLATCRENKIIGVLGNVISPILLVSLSIIIVKGIVQRGSMTVTQQNPYEIFTTNFIRGYETLDLLGAIFFASIIITLLKYNARGTYSARQLSTIGLKAGIFGIGLLSIVYVGMSILGMFYGSGLEALDGGQLFRNIAFQILGTHGTAIVATAVLMACLSTSIALSAVVAEYIENTVMNNNVSYIQALVITILASLPLSTFGLSTVLTLTGGPIVYIGYPLIITLTFCNLAHVLFGFKPVKIPVLITGLLAAVLYFM
jgi:branched-chain amino acid:cation transporter, LIVCS family